MVLQARYLLLDEPTAGLHPRDTEGLVAVLKKLRDLGNTVLVIEHDPTSCSYVRLSIDRCTATYV